MSILTLNNVSLAFGHHPILDNVNLDISPGERICLVGRNGTGKSTLFRVITGEAMPDDGEIWRKETLRISHLEQDVPPDTSMTIYDVVASGLGEMGSLLAEYHHAVHHFNESDKESVNRLSDLQHRIELMDGWNINQKIDTVLSRLDLPEDKLFSDCSGGVRRRVMLAQALVSEPELLLLDEPTNHMDITAILWLEEFLMSFNGALIFITHDRTFLKHLATRLIELDRGELTSFPGDYEYYLTKKDELLEIETRANKKFDKKLAEYEAWVRQGIKARRTRNEGKVRALQAMRVERSKRIEKQGRVSIDVDKGDDSGKRVVDLQHVSFSYDDHCIIRDLSTRIMRRDRIGIIGPNGSGKSTLLKLILGRIQPDLGQVIMGTKLQLAYFDQQREQLDLEKTVRENISDGSDYINVKGRSRHVISYLKDFLFPPERIDAPVRILSGGERNRLLLAKMFTKPANMMILDEPTNDLDVDTLELLEELLTDYDGTLLLVSHDRAFLDNVVTSTLVFEGDGHVAEYVGGYEDWLRQRKTERTKDNISNLAKERPTIIESASKQKLSYKETRELTALPEQIENLECEQAQLERQVSESDFYRQDKESIRIILDRIEQVNTELNHAYERWAYLDGIGK